MTFLWCMSLYSTQGPFKFMSKRASESGLPVLVPSTPENGLPCLKDPLQREMGIFHSYGDRQLMLRPCTCRQSKGAAEVLLQETVTMGTRITGDQCVLLVPILTEREGGQVSLSTEVFKLAASWM